MPRSHFPYIKRVHARGKVYEYFIGGKDPDGKPILKRLPPRSDKSWGQVYAGYLAARNTRRDVLVVPTVAEVSRRYQLSDRFTKRSENTQSTYLIYLRLIEEKLGIAGIDQVERRDVQALLDTMASRPGAAAMTLLVLRHLFRLAVQREWVKVDPTATFETPKTGGDEHEPWPEPLLEEALASDDPQVRVPVALMYYTAQRIGDVCKMRWNDIRDGEIYIKQQKTGKEVEFPVHEELEAVLATVPKVGFTILPGKGGKPARPDTVRVRLQRWATERGYEIVPHGLRKNAVMTLLEIGCTVAEVSSISGQTLALVEHYAKRRNNRRIGKAAILKWQGTKRENSKRVENR